MGTTKENEIIEDLLHGEMKIIQKKEGYRFSIDAILLASFVRAKKEDNMVDLGTGSGVIPLILSHKHPHARITGIEIDADSADMASRSVALNKLEEKITIQQGNLREIKNLFKAESFSIAVANPPYGRPNSGRINPTAEKASARHEIEGSLDDFIGAAAYLIKYRGKIFVIYPARRTTDLFAALRKNGLEPKVMRTVHSREGESAKLVLIEAVKGGGVEMEILKPLYIYDDKGEYTSEVEELYR